MKIDKKTIQILTDLKENPKSERVDHIELLDKIYWKYSNGISILKPIAHFFINGFDDIPSLKTKYLWNEEKYNEIKMPFINAHPELIEIINRILKTETEQTEYSLTKTEFLKQIKIGIIEFVNIDLENISLKGENLENIIFKNCCLSVDFRNSNLTNVKFIKGNIKTSDFRNANLTNVLIENVSFEGTKFKGAITKGLIFNENYCFSKEGIGQQDFNDWIIETE